MPSTPFFKYKEAKLELFRSFVNPLVKKVLMDEFQIDFQRSGVLRLVVDDRIMGKYTNVLRSDYFLKYF